MQSDQPCYNTNAPTTPTRSDNRTKRAVVLNEPPVQEVAARTLSLRDAPSLPDKEQHRPSNELADADKSICEAVEPLRGSNPSRDKLREFFAFVESLATRHFPDRALATREFVAEQTERILAATRHETREGVARTTPTASRAQTWAQVTRQGIADIQREREVNISAPEGTAIAAAKSNRHAVDIVNKAMGNTSAVAATKSRSGNWKVMMDSSASAKAVIPSKFGDGTEGCILPRVSRRGWTVVGW